MFLGFFSNASFIDFIFSIVVDIMIIIIFLTMLRPMKIEKRIFQKIN